MCCWIMKVQLISTHGCRSHLYTWISISSPMQSIHMWVHAGQEKHKLLSCDYVWRKVINLRLRIRSCSAGWPWIWVLCLKSTIMCKCKHCQIGLEGRLWDLVRNASGAFLAQGSMVVNLVRSWFIEALLIAGLKWKTCRTE